MDRTGDTEHGHGRTPEGSADGRAAGRPGPQGALRSLPAVHRLARHPLVRQATGSLPEGWVTPVVQEVIAEERQRLLAGAAPRTEDTLAEEVARRLQRLRRPSLRPVINATGIILHTNLGRAPLPEGAVEAVRAVAGGYCTLEFDLESGERGSRLDHVRDLLRLLTGAEDALVVNNNAAAVLLVLSALAAGREVVVSRGQLVEIGGSFRIPEILAQSGARLVEVGTTNKTRLSDYAAAITEQTALLLRVHASNYRIIGFTASVPLQDLARLGRQHGIPVVDDIGSGLLFPQPEPVFADEPAVTASLEAGADLVTFSGDKLLGGPQAGIVVGRADLIARLRRHPLMRALRCDKLVLAALEATLREYLDPEGARRRVPALAMLVRDPQELERAAASLAERLQRRLGKAAEVIVVPGRSQAGGGSLPGVELDTTLVGIRTAAPATRLARALRVGEPPVIGRVQDETFWLDPRTVPEDQWEPLVQAVVAAVERVAASPAARGER
ncbi:MAG: L-seryl-tRNA(Sec) selenium transferase [Bacillota bacterium]|nr:MAG: L-seryl-tRNA(Sec) selenium transferase [Bacillota bacterium]